MGRKLKPAAPRCVQCEERPARLLPCERRGKDGKVYEYVNGQRLGAVFCSLRCAANHALLWFDAEGFEGKLIECGHNVEE